MKQLQNRKILRKIWKYLMIALGAAIYAAAFQFFHDRIGIGRVLKIHLRRMEQLVVLGRRTSRSGKLLYLPRKVLILCFKCLGLFNGFLS